MQPSKYQINFKNHALNSTGHGISEAVAGSGKSTTIESTVLALCEYFPNKKIFIGAFNKHIEVSMTKRGFPSNVTIKTLNGFGHGILMRAFGRLQLDSFKSSNILKEICNPKDYFTLKGPVTRLVSLIKANNLREPSLNDLMEFREIHDLQISDKNLQLAIDVFNQGLSTKTYIDFDDQLFLPVYYDLPVPQFDFTFIDEYQDLNLVQLELTGRSVGSGGRFFAVGDSRQSIYAFRGADARAMQIFRERFTPTELPLSICYRCAKAIVREAKKICPEIEEFDGQSEGLVQSVSMETFPNTVKYGDFVLCRTTAPLVSMCLRMIRDGRRATVKGRDIGQGLITLVGKIQNSSDLKPFDAIQEWRMSEIEKFTRTEKEDQILATNDKADTLIAIIESVSLDRDKDSSGTNNLTVGYAAIIGKINQIFSDNDSEKDNEILFCTIHRSKGLEANRVFQLPSKPMKAKSDIQIQQERNLQYVCITRAKSEFYYVTQK